ncbi:hypothetical protein DL770_009997 [Monosporascus sp. CRB-9-2]|nr:hypothetical protein DL770_009997 [Monosporascus sp. CRB-9-2]
MRLINVRNGELEEVFPERAPPYAILSHVWDGRNEVTFQEWARRDTDEAVRGKSGYRKIADARQQAISDGLEWLWCDTNCIDKTSSAELSEAINSMFAWYTNSQVCYAYLDDVDIRSTRATRSSGSTAGVSKNAEENYPAPVDTQDVHLLLAKSRWFTRGWTLQELLAPSREVFFAKDWTVLGDRNQLSISISEIARIHIGALRDRSTIWQYSVAQRMSWAADRQTTRQEDVAYCLLGIFNIQMPMLYGEGIDAFQRLQRAIIKITDDQTILAWGVDDAAAAPSGGTTIRRDFQTWIFLRNVRDDLYQRVHLPISKAFLQQSYPYSVQWKSTSLYIEMRKSPEGRLRPMPPLLAPSIHNPQASSGLMLTLGWGTIDRLRQFEQAYLPEQFCAQVLKRRGPKQISHEILSSPNFSTVLSVSWDSHERANGWMHSTFTDTDMQFPTRLSKMDRWKCLFDNHTHSSITELSDPARRLRDIHEELRSEFVDAFHSADRSSAAPSVKFSSQQLQNLQGQSELLVELIFRKTPEGLAP